MREEENAEGCSEIADTDKMNEGEKEVGIWVPSKKGRREGGREGGGWLALWWCGEQGTSPSDCYGNISKALLLNVSSDQLATALLRQELAKRTTLAKKVFGGVCKFVPLWDSR